MKNKIIIPILLASFVMPCNVAGSGVNQNQNSIACEYKAEIAPEERNFPVFPVKDSYKIVKQYGFSSEYVSFTEIEAEGAVYSILHGTIKSADDLLLTISSNNIDITYAGLTTTLQKGDIVKAGDQIGTSNGMIKISGKKQGIPFNVLGEYFPETSIMNRLAEENRLQREALKKMEQKKQEKTEEKQDEKVNSKSIDNTEYDDMFQEAGARYELDPKLIKAVAFVESSFNPNIVSNKGAQGLMQLMPGTAKGLGVENPFDPCQNIDGGARYLRNQLDAYSDLTLALACYNAGPGAVKKYQGVPPFEETENYIKKVIAVYEKLKGGI